MARPLSDKPLPWKPVEIILGIQNAPRDDNQNGDQKNRYQESFYVIKKTHPSGYFFVFRIRKMRKKKSPKLFPDRKKAGKKQKGKKQKEEKHRNSSWTTNENSAIIIECFQQKSKQSRLTPHTPSPKRVRRLADPFRRRFA